MNWYYSQNGEQTGPVTRANIETLIANQELPADGLVWREGMAEWQPANVAFGGVSSASSVASNPPASSYSSNPDPLQAGIVTDTQINAKIKKASFPLVLLLGIVGFVFLVAGIGLFGYAEDGGGGEEFAMYGGVAILIGVIPLILSTVLSIIYVYRGWLILNECGNGIARATPGKAVGFLFIPFFNLYWMFQAYWGWAQDYNQTASRNGWQNKVPEGLFMAYCILNILSNIPLINYLALLGLIVVGPMMLYHLCKTINFHANC